MIEWVILSHKRLEVESDQVIRQLVPCVVRRIGANVLLGQENSLVVEMRVTRIGIALT